MSDKKLAEIICAALLAIVSALRKKYDLPTYHGVTVMLQNDLPNVTYTIPPCVTETDNSVLRGTS